MKRSLTALAAVLALATTACHNSDDLRKIEELTLQHQQDSMTIAGLKAQMGGMMARADQAAADGGIVTAYSNDGMPASDIDTFNAQIDALAATIATSKDEVAKLKTQLSSSKNQSAALKKQVADLEKSIATKEAAMASMRAKAEQDKSQIAALTQSVQELSEQAVSNVNMIRELVAKSAADAEKASRAYYVVGTQDMLEKQGIIEKAKGITRTRVWTGNTNPSLYKQVDTRTFEGLSLNVAKVKDIKFITSQSASSYTLTPEGSTTTLKITDVDAFWSSGRYLVIVLY